MAIKAVIFDFDGVILDSFAMKRNAYISIFPDAVEARAIVEAALDEIGTHTRFEVVPTIVALLKRQGLLPDDARPEPYLDAYAELTDGGMLQAPEVPGARAALEALSGEYLLFINTATPEPYIMPVLEKRDLARYFERVFGSDLGSKADNIRSILSGWNLDASEVIFLGDSPLDQEGAEATDVRFIAIDGAFPALNQDPEIMHLPDLLGLPDLVRQLGGTSEK